jgi:hypothetical protein
MSQAKKTRYTGATDQGRTVTGIGR